MPPKRRVTVVVHIDSKGKRYIILGKKKFFLDLTDKKSENDIIKLLIKSFLASQRKRKYRKRKRSTRENPLPFSISSQHHDSTLYNLINRTDNEVHSLQREVQRLKASSVPLSSVPLSSVPVPVLKDHKKGLHEF